MAEKTHLEIQLERIANAFEVIADKLYERNEVEKYYMKNSSPVHNGIIPRVKGYKICFHCGQEFDDDENEDE